MYVRAKKNNLPDRKRNTIADSAVSSFLPGAVSQRKETK